MLNRDEPLLRIPIILEIEETHRLDGISEAEKIEMATLKCLEMCGGLFWLMAKTSSAQNFCMRLCAWVS
jgi:hypothetical protein